MSYREQVLAIDSSPDSLNSTLRILRDEGFHAVGASSAREAISKVSKQRFDAILLDTRLRGEPASHILNSIEGDENVPHVPIILYSPYEEDFVPLSLSPTLSLSFLKKPLPPFELSKHIRETIRASTGHVNVDFVNPVLEATIHTITTMTEHAVAHGKPYIKKPGSVSGDICGIIPVESRGFNGTIAICFDEATFLKVVSKILGMEFKELDESMKRQVGELINIIFGQTKTRLQEKQLQIRMALPSPVVEKNHSIPQPKGRPCISVDFTIQDLGGFKVEVSVGNRI